MAAFRAGWEEIRPTPPAKPADLILHEYRPGQARNVIGDFAFCRGQAFSVVRIEDPYLLSDSYRFDSLCRFLDELGKLWQKWPSKLEIKTRDTGDQGQIIARLQRLLSSRGTSVEVRRVPTRGPHRVDFHDRRIVFHTENGNQRRRVTVLLTGGVDRYLDPQFECGIITNLGS
jgi:hypothetical protein